MKQLIASAPRPRFRKRWQPRHGDFYWYITKKGMTDGVQWLDSINDALRLRAGNVFANERQAQIVARLAK